jgi:hypothetical protein
VKGLKELWGTPHFHFWHSQQFSIYLALLILDENLLEDAAPKLRELLNRQSAAMAQWQRERPSKCMGGPLFFVGWAMAYGSTISDSMAMSDASSAKKKLEKEFPQIQEFNQGL